MPSRPVTRSVAGRRPAVPLAGRASAPPLARPGVFDAQAFLDSTGVTRRQLRLRKGAVVYAQGDAAEAVMYLQEGAVTLTVLSSGGREAVVGLMGPGDFFGEGCLAGQSVRMGTATTTMATTVLAIARREMAAVLHEQHALSDLFIAYVLARNIRIEEDLVDQLFNSSEKRLARTLLLLSRYGKAEASHHVLPKLSQQTLAEMVGTTRSRVNMFMNKFRKLGFIEYNDGIHVNHSLLSVVLHD
jgi:CRP-like cAMP-binding protein